MTNADLVWRLVELLIKKENDTKQVALAQDQIPNDTKKQDDKGHKKAQLAKKECSTTTLLCYFYIIKNERTKCYHTSSSLDHTND